MTYDCFPFFNELELLEIRLQELEGVVDRFVLVEATRTHSDQPKPLYFAENSDHFAAWKHRIVHVVVDDMPEGGDPWVRERYQRRCIARGLLDCAPGDLVLVSDADEIPRASRVRKAIRHPGVTVFQQLMCYYFLNNVTSTPWLGTRMARYQTICDLGGTQGLRQSEGTVVQHGGWHFSYMGGVKRIQTKLQAFAHQEYNTSTYTDPEEIGERLRRNGDLFGRSDRWTVAADLDLPRFVLDNKARFADWLLDVPPADELDQTEKRCRQLRDLFTAVADLPGAVLEIGCREGTDTVVLANACYPETLIAVPLRARDRTDASPRPGDHKLSEHGLLPEFVRNVRMLTMGNVQPMIAGPNQLPVSAGAPIKFCHLCGSTDREQTKASVASALASLVPGGIICGDDTPPVISAAREVLPNHVQRDGVWWWQCPPEL